MTAVEWLVEQIDGLDTATSYHYFKEKVEQAKEMEKQQMIEMHDKGFDSVKQLNGEYAIEFAEWTSFYRDKNRNVHGNMLHAKSKYDDTYTTKELLEIFKKEKGL
jgi:hypothetical protein